MTSIKQMIQQKRYNFDNGALVITTGFVLGSWGVYVLGKTVPAINAPSLRAAGSGAESYIVAKTAVSQGNSRRAISELVHERCRAALLGAGCTP